MVVFIVMNSSCAFAGPLKILALGDSYTIGEGVKAEDRWPMQLKDRWQAKGINIATLNIVAQTGWTTQGLLSVLEKEDLKNDHDLVFVMIGANDQFQQRSISVFSRDLNDLLLKAIGFARNDPAKVAAVSVPDWGFSPLASGRDQKKISRQIDLFNQASQSIADNLGVRWINITDLSRRTAGPSDFVPDGLHPTAATYGSWVDIIFPAVEDVVLEGSKKQGEF